jgi:hypothetical protein
MARLLPREETGELKILSVEAAPRGEHLRIMKSTKAIQMMRHPIHSWTDKLHR